MSNNSIDYMLSRVLGRIPNDRVTKRRLLLAGSIILNLGLLVYFKYANFFVGQMNAIFDFLGQDAIPWRDIALPIGISFWFREYLYVPLGGNRGSTFRTYVNLWIVFLCSGLWHGASWNFVVWGAFHGLFLTLHKIFYEKQRFHLPPTAARVKTFLLVSLGWVFFRCETFTHVFQYFRHMFNFSSIHTLTLWIYEKTVFDHRTIATFILASLICFILDTRHFKEHFMTKWSAYHAMVSFKNVFAFLLLMLSLCSLANMDFNPFIYFRF